MAKKVSFPYPDASTRMLDTPAGRFVLQVGRGEVRVVATDALPRADGWMAAVEGEVERFLGTEDGKRFWHLCLEVAAASELKKARSALESARNALGAAEQAAYEAEGAVLVAEGKVAALLAGRPGKAILEAA